MSTKAQESKTKRIKAAIKRQRQEITQNLPLTERSRTASQTETEGEPSSPVRRQGQELEKVQLKRKQKEVLATGLTQQEEMARSIFTSATGPNQTGDVPIPNATVQDVQNAATMTDHYADPYSHYGHYAQSAMGFGSMFINLSNEENREMFQMAQDAALTQYNQNNYMKQQAMMESYRFRGTPQFIKFEDWNKIRVSREMAQLRLKFEQSNRDAAIMKMGQLEEQKRRNAWFNYHYPSEPKFI